MERRTFFQSLPAGAMFAANLAGANDRVNVAMIGVRNQGRALTANFSSQPLANIAALCDVHESSFGRALEAVEKSGRPKPRLHSDLRRVLDDKSIDAVVIATPDHWHAPATILACDAGKDVYVEKPASHNLREGRLMVDAARRNKRVVQLGTQSRSRPSTKRAIELIHGGAIGKVLMAKAWDVQLREDIGHKADSAPPAGLDFDIWTGPAPMLPFNENRFHYKWHWNWNYGTGDSGNDGVHQMDMCRWALQVESPAAVTGMGKKLFFDDDQQTPDTMNVTYDFGGKLIQFEMRIWNPYGMEEQENGVAVYGSDGSIQIGRWKGVWGYRHYDAKGKLIEDTSKTPAVPDKEHAANFLRCIQSRQAPNAEIAIGHASSSLCHLGNIVARTGRALKFDAAKETIVGDAEANRLLRREYRSHWSVPKGV
ncbi:MAG: Gfo/Idh/MocA family oxidoreductase [Bryobacteraceae bacterium]|nr:Gfo/Idh/MocA family oxidoreductase [Bryobacteraceae bacterium]